MFAWISGVWRKSKALFHRLTQDVQRANLRSRTGDPTWVLTEWLLKCWLWLSRGEKKFWHTLYTAPQMAKANMSICSTNLMVFFIVCERTSTRTKSSAAPTSASCPVLCTQPKRTLVAGCQNRTGVRRSDLRRLLGVSSLCASKNERTLVVTD